MPDVTRPNNSDIGTQPDVVTDGDRAGDILAPNRNLVRPTDYLDTVGRQQTVTNPKLCEVPNVEVVAKSAIRPGFERPHAKYSEAWRYLATATDRYT